MYTGGSHLIPSSLSTENGNTADKMVTSSNKVDSVCELVKLAVEKVDANR